MIGMTIRPIWNRKRLWLMTADERHGCVQMRRILSDSPIRPVQVLTPDRPEDDASRFGLCEPLVGRSVGTHLACCEIAQANLHAKRGVPRDRSAHPDLDIVGVRAKSEKVDHRVNENASSLDSTSSR